MSTQAVSLKENIDYFTLPVLRDWKAQSGSASRNNTRPVQTRPIAETRKPSEKRTQGPLEDDDDKHFVKYD
jgi:hypothetical protein